jgi:hypothetical protein
MALVGRTSRGISGRFSGAPRRGGGRLCGAPHGLSALLTGLPGFLACVVCATVELTAIAGVRLVPLAGFNGSSCFRGLSHCYFLYHLRIVFPSEFAAEGSGAIFWS